ncbi:MAG: hypothetical protein AUJ20_14745 [Comamonadaceae bacterium CG1_02_60_18]|nr:MAG: hypothetical protein AUJ20_14745 [Comamonadaceae bacterium CG1_02_60_18]PIQ55803.1 MAG: hypothetical protein COW02_02320 [Comamonadaceae bacterium CG12_big_fil_rev_8_21_14_0_65_59_15]
MAKTYQLKALWPLLAFETAPAPLLATLDAYGGELVKYAVTQDGFWLFSQSQPFDANESEGLTGFHPADLAPKQIDGVEGYFYGLQNGTPLLPLPFTAAQLIEFDKRTARLVAGNIERGSETDGWITDLAKENPDAAELARAIHAGKWPVATAKPRFHLAGGIVPDASAKAVKSARDQIQQQQDAMRLTGISPLLLNDINRVKEYQKLISPTSIADTAYLQAMQPSEALLRAAIPTNNQAVADLLSQQKISLSVVDDVMANAYLQTQRAAQLDIGQRLRRLCGVGPRPPRGLPQNRVKTRRLSAAACWCRCGA